MPIISAVGARSWKTRLVYAFIYLVLSLGALTMVYPLALMLSGSTKSVADETLITPWPGFWTDDTLLFQKYIESKHNTDISISRTTLDLPLTDWRKLASPAFTPIREGGAPKGRGENAETPATSATHLCNSATLQLCNFLLWRSTPGARAIADLGHARGWGLLPKNGREYRAAAIARYGRDGLAAYRRDTGALVTGWAGVSPPREWVGRYRNRAITPVWQAFYNDFLTSRPTEDFFFVNPEGQYAQEFLPGLYGASIADYNAAHGTSHAAYADIRLPATVPTSPAERADWSRFLRTKVRLSLLRLSPDAEPAFREHLRRQYSGNPALFNHAHATDFASLDAIPFPAALDDHPFLRMDFESFLQSDLCTDTFLRLHGPYEQFLDWLQCQGYPVDGVPSLGTLVLWTDYHDCMEHKAALRREFTTRNYRHVLEYVGMHGNGFRNTAIYCGLAVLVCLLVNPLAAYALSRFKLRGTYQILLFCMATMAFPAEVSMIPAFVLTKRFPLWPLAGAIAALVLVFLLLARFAPRLRERTRLLLSLVAATLVGTLLVPAIAPDRTFVSLLNTWAALVLPGMANGYSIFLLKGFFDSMPKELYEAADIDGAGEWTKFWMLTMSLSKPILAVLALNAFTRAYSAFMQALIIMPDERMWTLMVWIYQLQNSTRGSVVYASLVIAAIPTFLIFAFCQNIILRGIVVPTEK